MRDPKKHSRLEFLASVTAISVALSASPRAQSMLDLLARAGDHLGSTVLPAGDFDRDGTPDVLFGIDQTYGRQRTTYVRGATCILSGRNGELLFFVTGDQYEALTGTPPGDYFGRECGMVGDLDLDGVCDVLVVHGNPKVLRKIVAFSGRTRAILFEISDPYRRTDFGDQIVRLGDLFDPQGNLVPDGVPDFAVTAPSNPISVPPPTYPGLVRIYSGASPGNGPVVTLIGQSALAGFGASIAQVGDLDGDGRPGLAVGAPGAGYVELFDGPGFLSWGVVPSPLRPAALFGHSLANLGDLDGNGTIELAVGAPGAQQGTGRVIVYSLDPFGPTNPVVQLDPFSASPGSGFGSQVAGLPVDPMTGRGLLDLDHDGNPDPFFDSNRDGKADYLVSARGFDNFLGGNTGAGGVFLVRGSGQAFESAVEAIHQGPDDPLAYSYLPGRTARQDEWFGFRAVILGNPAGESQARLAIGTPRDEKNRGSLAVLRPPMLHFDDDTFSRASDGVGTSRLLEVDCGPRYAGRGFRILASTTGTFPGQSLQGFRVPLNDDGPGGLWQHTLAGIAGGTPLAFSQLTGSLDSAGRATITVAVTGPTAGHPWFATFRQHYVLVLTKPGQPGSFSQVGAATYLSIL
jgi:hypothetical protein